MAVGGGICKEWMRRLLDGDIDCDVRPVIGEGKSEA